MSEHIAISGVCERDIDLMLLEEFLSESQFDSWFTEETNINNLNDLQMEIAGQSVTTSFGESDLEVTYRRPNGSKVMLLIENKISAGFQPKQADRYRLRGQNYVSRDLIDEFYTILVCPLGYFKDTLQGFDARVDYENILNWFKDANDLGARRRYKITLMNSALERATIGYQLKEDSVITDFWGEYWRLVESMDANLRSSAKVRQG